MAEKLQPTSSPADKREWLMEGFHDEWTPTTTYVRQGNKVMFFQGGTNTLDESSALGESVQIVESLNDLELVERDGKNYVKDGTWVVEGVFQRSDVRNQNKRIYRRKLWETRIGNANGGVQKAIKDRSMIGHFEHPKDGKTDGNLGALLVTGLKLLEDGRVWGRAELLDSVPGNTLRNFTRDRVKWGVSSRGRGTVDNSGYVNEDYELVTFDATMTPSTPGANPRPVGEASPKTNEADKQLHNVTAVSEAVTTDDAKALVEEIEALCAAPLMESTLADKIALARKLASKVNVVAGHLQQKTLTPGDVAAALNHAASTLATICEDIPSPEEMLAASDHAEKLDERADFADHNGYPRIIAALQKRLDDNDTALEVTRERAAQVEPLTEQAESLQDAGQILRERVEELEQQLETALNALAEKTETTTTSPVDEAVDEVISGNPNLLEFREALTGCITPAQVRKLAGRLTTGVKSAPTAQRASTIAMLPESADIRSDPVSSFRPSPAAGSRGAQVAAGALARMTSKTSSK